MCFDHDSHPPIPPMAGAAVDGAPLILDAVDDNHLRAFHARAGAQPSRAAVVIIPDVRGLHPYYEELALRFAEAGIDALAIDLYGRTAGTEPRDAGFQFQSHAAQTRYASMTADLNAAVQHLTTEADRARRIFTIGFCAGGRLSFLAATQRQLGLAGVIGFYGWPVGASRNDTPAPLDSVSAMTCPVLGIFGGSDQGIPQDAIFKFEQALQAAGVENEIVTYRGAPHSFFDRKADEFAEASEDAWRRVLAFIERHSTADSEPLS
jgi:carboxymethylenebutenolidase